MAVFDFEGQEKQGLCIFGGLRILREGAEKSRVSLRLPFADQTLIKAWPSIFGACAQVATPT